MAQFENMRKVELKNGEPAVFYLRQLYYADIEANRIGAIVYMAGEPFALSGTCTGTVIRADGATVPMTGTVEGNQAYITLNADCYAVEGDIQIFVKLTTGTVTATLVAARGTVRLTETGAVIDPGEIIPSVSALITAIDDAVASIPADYSDLLAAIAPNYADLVYPVAAGTWCWNEGGLYRAKVDIPASETWTAAHWETAPLGNALAGDIAGLKSALPITNENVKTMAQDTYALSAVTPWANTAGYRLDGNGNSVSDENYVLRKYKELAPGTEIFIISEYPFQFQKNNANVPTSNNTNLIAVYPTWNGRITVPEEGTYLVVMAKSGDGNGIYTYQGIRNYVDNSVQNVQEIASTANALAESAAQKANAKIPLDPFSTEGQTVVFYPAAETKPNISWTGKIAQSGSGDPSPTNVRPFSSAVSFTKYGKNLIFPTLYTTSKGGLTWTINADYSVKISGTCNANGTFNLMTRHLAKGIYRLQGSYGCGSVSIEVIDTNNVSYGIVTSGFKSKLIYIPADGTYIIRYIHIASSAEINAVSYPMLTAGTGYHDYEKYTASTIVVPIPEHFGGGTIAADGTVIITHYLDMLDANTAVSSPSMGNNGTYRYALTKYESTTALRPNTGIWETAYDISCSALKTVAVNALYNVATPNIIAVPQNGQQIHIRVPYSTAEEVKAWFGEMAAANTPVVINYLLATPMEAVGTPFTITMDGGYNTLTASSGSISVSGYQSSDAALKHTPVMTFMDDDGRSGSFETLQTIMMNAGVPVSSALVTAYVNDPNNTMYMDWDDVRQLRGLGASCCSHTDGHIQLDPSIVQPDGVYSGQTVTLEQMEADLRQSQERLDEHNCDIKTLVYPHGTLTSATEALVRKYFSAGVMITEGMNELPIRPYRLMRYNLPRTQSSTPVARTLDDWKQLADYCAASGGWLIWMMHSYSDNYTSQQLADIVSLCEYASSIGIEIMNFEDAFQYMRNRVTNGDINGSDYYIVDRDGNVYTDS